MVKRIMSSKAFYKARNSTNIAYTYWKNKKCKGGCILGENNGCKVGCILGQNNECKGESTSLPFILCFFAKNVPFIRSILTKFGTIFFMILDHTHILIPFGQSMITLGKPEHNEAFAQISSSVRFPHYIVKMKGKYILA